MKMASAATNGVPKKPRRSIRRFVARIVHPFARRRRTAAHRRVLHRRRHTGLVTGIPTERFELTEFNRRVLGLDPGPPVAPLPGAANSYHAVEHEGTDVEVGPSTEPMSAVGQPDAIGDAISLALGDLNDREVPEE
jgi:hypothetical protein